MSVTPAVVRYQLVRMDQLCRAGKMGPAAAQAVLRRCWAIDRKTTLATLKYLSKHGGTP